MLFKASIAPLLLLGLQFLTQTWACTLPVLRRADGSQNGNETFPSVVLGSDEPSDPATAGNFINHLCIISKNLTATMHFYGQAFGLRQIFTVQVSEHFSITYMGHSHGGRNGTGFQTVDEMNRQKNNIEGLLEILAINVPENDGPSTNNKFSHIGVVVPDIKETQTRLEKMGANILKNTGDPQTAEGLALFASISPKLDPKELDQVVEILNPLNTPLILVGDPDGNIVEVQAQEGSALVS